MDNEVIEKLKKAKEQCLLYDTLSASMTIDQALALLAEPKAKPTTDTQETIQQIEADRIKQRDTHRAEIRRLEAALAASEEKAKKRGEAVIMLRNWMSTSKLFAMPKIDYKLKIILQDDFEECTGEKI